MMGSRMDGLKRALGGLGGSESAPPPPEMATEPLDVAQSVSAPAGADIQALLPLLLELLGKGAPETSMTDEVNSAQDMIGKMRTGNGLMR